MTYCATPLAYKLSVDLSVSIDDDFPLRIAGMAAWFDTRVDARDFTFSAGSSVSSWKSRTGSLGAVSFDQATPGNQATRATSVATFNNLPALLFDGVDDRYVANSTAPWAILHSGAGASWFGVYRMDSTGGASQQLLLSANAIGEIGVFQQYSATTGVHRVANGSGSAWVNNWTSPAGHGTRDTTKWQAWSHAAGTQSMYSSGLTSTNADGAAPSTSNPTRALIVGSGTVATNSPFKGYIAQLLFFSRVLSVGDIAALTSWAKAIYGVAQ